MADSPKHKFISESLDRALKNYPETCLLGLKEAERRTFDYGCIVLRDEAGRRSMRFLPPIAEILKLDPYYEVSE